MPKFNITDHTGSQQEIDFDVTAYAWRRSTPPRLAALPLSSSAWPSLACLFAVIALPASTRQQ